MNFLEERILKDGQVLNSDILKVDSFLNHQLDVELLERIGDEFYERFKDDGITKIVTIEASGIAIAVMTARKFGVPVVFAKKARSRNLDAEVLISTVHSFTYNRDYTITVSRKYLEPDDRILIVDDFMANGLAAEGLISLCEQAGADVAGLGICVEKGFQEGGKSIRAKGYRIESIAIIDEMSENMIKFREQ